MAGCAIGAGEAWPSVAGERTRDARGAAHRRRRAAAPAPVLLLILCFLAPTELSLYLAGLRLPPHRIALLLLVPLAVWRFVTARAIRPRAFDVAAALYAAWTVVVFIAHGGPGEGLQFGGSLALEAFGAFIVARAYVTTLEQFQATLTALVGAVAAAALIALPETITGVHYVHDLLRELTGYVHPIGHEVRLGLTRAYGTFDHPIHLGTFCASLLALVWYGQRARCCWSGRVGIVVGATVLGLSSAPLLCLGLQVGFIAWDRATRTVPHRMLLTLAAVAVAYGLLSVVMTRSPVNLIATGMTLDSWTGFYRLMIWEHGLQSVWANPWMGIGLGEWERPAWMASASVDAFWLVIAMRAGLPAFALLALFIGLIVRSAMVRRRRSRSVAEKRAALGWMIALTALSLVACTVHFWNVLHTYFFFFLGLAGWLANPIPAAARCPARETTFRAVPDDAWAS